jgi:predicted RNA-binding Zn-ribbon protein involved in translation (DUF1610 family)
MLDIETAPNVAHVWGMYKQNVSLNQLLNSSYTMCFAAKWYKEKEVTFRSIHHDGERVMLNTLHSLLNEADAVVHYNGTKFDIPTCNKEFLLKNMPPPDPYHQIDLLKVARNRFRFTSNKLDYVAQILNVGKKVKHIGHELWVKCMAGDAESWNTMKEYNINDIIILEEVYKKILPWIKNHPNHGLYTASDRPVCPNCGSDHVIKKGIDTTSIAIYQRFRCTDCGTPIRSRKNSTDPIMKENLLTQSKI